MTKKRSTGRCSWCASQVPSNFRADRKTCSERCRGAQRRAGNPGRHLAWRYGITPSRREELLREQGGRCLLCGRRDEDCLPHGLHVDHDHLTGKVRSLLCASCNTGLGKLQDDPDILRAAASYIEEHRALPAFVPN